MNYLALDYCLKSRFPSTAHFRKTETAVEIELEDDLFTSRPVVFDRNVSLEEILKKFPHFSEEEIVKINNFLSVFEKVGEI